MASTIDTDAYSNALVFLGTAGVVVPLVRRFGVSPILGYLGAGAISAPLGLGSFSDQMPVFTGSRSSTRRASGVSPNSASCSCCSSSASSFRSIGW